VRVGELIENLKKYPPYYDVRILLIEPGEIATFEHFWVTQGNYQSYEPSAATQAIVNIHVECA